MITNKSKFMNLMAITSLLFPYLLLLPLTFFLVKFLLPSKSALPPGPFLWTFLGKKPHVQFAKLAKTYGPLMTLKVGCQTIIVASSKPAAIEVLKTHDRILCGRYVPHVAPAKTEEMNKLSIGFVVECNKDWRTTRTTCQSDLFTGRSIQSQSSLREKKTVDLVRFVAKMEGKVVSFRNLAFATILSILGQLLVSKDLVRFEEECVDAKVCELVREILKLATANNISDYFPILGGLDLQGLRKKSMGYVEEMYRLWADIVKERRMQKKSTHQDFLDTCIENGLSDDQINMMFLELFSAGADTSSSVIEWTMAQMFKNPRIMKKLQQELETQIPKGEEIKESMLNDLPYLQACVKETLRLHPPGPLLLPHRAIEMCQVMGYTIPEDSQVVVNYWSIGRDPEYWEDPLEYKPERFLNSKLDYKGNHFEYFPFSSGRRTCPGMPMATKQVPLLLACMIRLFDWSLPEGTTSDNLDMSEAYGLTVMKEHRLLLIPRAKL